MYEYKVIIDDSDFLEVYHRMLDENLLWAFFPEFEPEDLNDESAIAMFSRKELLMLGGYVDGKLAGILTLCPLRYRSRGGEIGVLAFRKYFKIAIDLCRGALEWVFRTQNVDSVVGYIPTASRQSLRIYEQLGFESLGRIPGMYWYTRKQKFVGAEVVVLTRETIEEESYGKGRRKLSGSGTDSGEAGDEKFECGCSGCVRCSKAEAEEEQGTCCVNNDI